MTSKAVRTKLSGVVAVLLCSTSNSQLIARLKPLNGTAVWPAKLSVVLCLKAQSFSTYGRLFTVGVNVGNVAGAVSGNVNVRARKSSLTVDIPPSGISTAAAARWQPANLK